MKRWMLGLLLFLSTMLLVGCKNEEVMEGKHYNIYYMNAAGTRLEPYEYEAVSEDMDGLIEELMAKFMQVPNDLENQSALPEKVLYKTHRLQDKVLYLEFDSNYTAIKPTREILCRAALTKTLTQIEGVDYISIYAGNQPLLNASGNPVGFLSDGDFIDNISDVNSFEKTEITLYFSDLAGEKLVKETREVVHDVSTSLEKLVIEQLILGPQKKGVSATLPKDTKLLNVSVNENVCYINFNSAFLSNPLEVKEYIPIYSIVNSLAEISTINTIQIAVNGSSDVYFRDSISLNKPFERNLDYNTESYLK